MTMETNKNLLIAAMNVKLKPCPFCGGRAHIEDISGPDDMGPIWMILCKKCGASASFGMDGCDATQVEAVDSWNRRAEMNNTRKVHCVYCGLISEMSVIETGCVSDGKPIKMYKVRCPQCGQEQWTHDKGEKKCVR